MLCNCISEALNRPCPNVSGTPFQMDTCSTNPNNIEWSPPSQSVNYLHSKHAKQFFKSGTCCALTDQSVCSKACADSAKETHKFFASAGITCTAKFFASMNGPNRFDFLLRHHIISGGLSETLAKLFTVMPSGSSWLMQVIIVTPVGKFASA